jgi:predicted MFS family arabinose efflux permease
MPDASSPIADDANSSRAMNALGNEETIAPQIGPTTSTMPRMIAALHHRDFRLFWFGNFLSNIGTWMQNVAQSWLVLQLAPVNSAFWLGVIGFAASAPMLVFTILGGVIADRVDKRKLMYVTQGSMMVLAFLMWGLTYFHHINVRLIVLLAFANGLAMSLNTPAYQALVPQLIPRKDLTNAIALNSAQFNLSRVLGPTLGGFAMAAVGISGNFMLNALSFVAVLIALAQITYPPAYPAVEQGLWETMNEGFRYLFGRRDMSMLLTLTAVASVLGIPYVTFVPLFAKDILHLDERGFGLLMAAAGIGAFLGAATIAYVRDIKRRGRFVVGSGFAFYVFVILFAFAKNEVVSGIMLAGANYCMILMVATVNSLLQHLAADEMRGRVMSIYATAFLGFAPIGSLLAGSLADSFGAPNTIAVMAALALVLSMAIYSTQPVLRKIR